MGASRLAVEAILRRPDRDGQWAKALRSLPDDVDPELAATVALSFLEPRSGYWFARRCQHLPAPVIRVVLHRLEAMPPTPTTLLVREAMARSTRLSVDWPRVLHLVHQLEKPMLLSSKSRRTATRQFARGPWLSALQAAVSGTQQVFRTPGRYRDDVLAMFAVLVADGSLESVDALMPHFVAAVSGEATNAINQLEALRVHATGTPAVAALFAELQSRLAARNTGSTVLAFVRGLGFAVDTIDVALSVSSVELTASHVPRYQTHVRLDSQSAEGFRVNVSQVDLLVDGLATRFDGLGVNADTLGLGACTLADLPTWYQRAARVLRVSWNWPSAHLSGLRGKKKAQLLAWLSAR